MEQCGLFLRPKSSEIQEKEKKKNGKVLVSRECSFFATHQSLVVPAERKRESKREGERVECGFIGCGFFFSLLSPSFAPLSSHSVQRWWALWPRGIEDRRQLPLSSTFSVCHRSFILPLLLASPLNNQPPRTRIWPRPTSNPTQNLLTGHFVWISSPVSQWLNQRVCNLSILLQRVRDFPKKRQTHNQSIVQTSRLPFPPQQ